MGCTNEASSVSYEEGYQMDTDTAKLHERDGGVAIVDSGLKIRKW